MYLANRARDLRRGYAITNAPTGHRISFRHRVNDDCAFPHAVELGHRDVFDLGAVARVEDVFVNLIREAKRIELLAEPGDKLHLVASENFSSRIIRIAND